MNYSIKVVLVESVSGMGEHYNSNGNARKTKWEVFSLYSMCPINVRIYWRRFAFQVQLLFYIFTTIIFPEYSWTYM